MKKNIFAFFTLLAILLAVGIWYGFSKSAVTKSSGDPTKPIVEVKEPVFDLGKMSVKDVREKEFTVTNVGKSDLNLTNFSTSCGCTYAYVIKDKEKSPKFSMRINSNWQTLLEPGKSLVVKATYEPASMPVEGKVQRAITFATNDPDRPTVELKLLAEVYK